MRFAIFGAAAMLLLTLAAAPAGATNTFTPNLHLLSYAVQFPFLAQDVEPEIRVDSTGRIFAVAIHGVGAGVDLWQISPTGSSFIYRGEPDGLPVTNPNSLTLAPGGGDADLAIGSFTATQPGPLIISSLNLATVFSSTTTNGGQSYLYNPNAAGLIVGDDRQWNNAQGGLERYTVVHDLATDNVEFARSLDGGLTWLNGTPTTLAIFGTSTQDNEIGPIAVDQIRHILYNVFVSTANVIENANGFPLHTIWVSSSTNDGLTWAPVIAYNGPTTTVAPVSPNLDHLFPSIAVDAAGNVYAVWSNDVDVFLSFSTTHGATWSRAIRVSNSSLDGGFQQHIFPWVAAGANGGVDVVYYETMSPPICNSTTPPSSCPANGPSWVVGFAQNTNVIAAPNNWTFAVASDHINHTGQICENGLGCNTTQPGNRHLADDFQVAIDPRGFANIVYTDDHDTSIVPQTYFTKQNGGNSIGTPNGDFGKSRGGQGDGSDALGDDVQFRLKAPDYSLGWLTVAVNKQMVLSGFVSYYLPSSSTAVTFAGRSLSGVAFSGSIVNGALRVVAGLTVIQATMRTGTYAFY